MIKITVALVREGAVEASVDVRMAVSSTVYGALMQAKSQDLAIPDAREVILDQGDGNPMTIATGKESAMKITGHATITVRETLPPATEKVWIN